VQHKTIPVPDNLKDLKPDPGTWLRQILDLESQHGWVFVKDVEIKTWRSPGCIPGLFGAGPIPVRHHVLVFRKD